MTLIKLTKERWIWCQCAMTLAAAATLMGCVVADEGGTFVADNNNRRLDAPVVAPTSLNGDRQARTVPVELLWFETGDENLDVTLRIESAQVISTDQGGAVNLYAEVFNDGADPVCFVKGTSIQLFDELAVPLATKEHEFIEGSLAYWEAVDRNLPSCLAANGGFGYFSSIIPGVDADAVRSMSIIMDGSDAREEHAPREELVPVAAQAGLAATGRIDITVENQGDRPMQIGFFKVSYFDADGGFLDWAFVYDGTLDPIAAGERRVVGAPTFGLPRPPAELMISIDAQPTD